MPLRYSRLPRNHAGSCKKIACKEGRDKEKLNTRAFSSQRKNLPATQIFACEIQKLRSHGKVGLQFT